MKEIKFELTIEKVYEGSCPLDELLDWLEMTEEEWNALSKEQQESFMHDYYEDIVCDIDYNGCDSMGYNIEIKEQ